jgi:cell division topological specificity factor
VARERLQILLKYERNLVSQTDLIAVLREEILAVVSRHVTIDQERVQIKVERQAESSIFEIEIDIPDDTLVTPSFWAQPSSTQDPSSIH